MHAFQIFQPAGPDVIHTTLLHIIQLLVMQGMFFNAQIPAQKPFRLYPKIKTNTCRNYLSPNQINELINKADRLQLFP